MREAEQEVMRGMVTDALPSTLRASKISSLWLMQTVVTMVLCVVRVFTVRTRKTTQIPEPFTPTCFDPVSCPAIIVGPSTEKEGL